VTLLREDASGEPYFRPLGKSLSDRFLTLNHAFWLDGWRDKLKLPGLAMLLVALHETGPDKPVFQLPAEHAPKWYGWSLTRPNGAWLSYATMVYSTASPGSARSH
jgi:hypothetical protein